MEPPYFFFFKIIIIYILVRKAKLVAIYFVFQAYVKTKGTKTIAQRMGDR